MYVCMYFVFAEVERGCYNRLGWGGWYGVERILYDN